MALAFLGFGKSLQIHIDEAWITMLEMRGSHCTLLHGNIHHTVIYITVLHTQYSHVDFSSFSRLPNVYARPQPTTLTAQRARDAPRTAPLTVNLFLNFYL